MEVMTGEVDGCDFGIGDGDGFRVAIAIEFAAHREAGPGRGGSDQLDDDLMADQRLFILETLWLTFVGLLFAQFVNCGWPGVVVCQGCGRF